MSAIVDRIAAEAAARGEPLAPAIRHHLIVGVIDRVARTPRGDAFVLRGGILTRAWIAPLPRPAKDLDYVGDFPFDVDDTVRRFRPALEIDLEDGVVIDAAGFAGHGIWLDSEFPGVRLRLPLGLDTVDQQLTIDIGFRDPLVPPATTLVLPSGTAVRAVRPETQVAWKLHGLAEMGQSWRPKDLADLWRIATRVALDPIAMPPAIEAAFTSRGFAVTRATSVLHAAYWSTKTARVRWEATQRAGLPPLQAVVDEVRSRLAPLLPPG